MTAEGAVHAGQTHAPRVLTLFLSNGKSLRWWHEVGIFSREILLYLHLLERGVFDRVQIFSYSAQDRAFIAELAAQNPLYDRIDLLAPENNSFTSWRALLWGFYGPVRHRRRISQSHALKTNQISGSWSAFIAHWLTRRPLVLRMGYLQSINYTKAGYVVRAALARVVERVGFRIARFVLVSARDVAETLTANPVTRDKTVLTPTYVDVGTFTPKTEYRFDEPVIAVGRLTAAKNLVNLIKGCSLAGRDLVLVGTGELEEELRAAAAAADMKVTFAGTIQNEDLAATLRRHSVFALPSVYEGLPKVLVEAMASGLVCIGSRIPGIVDLIEDGKTGYLIGGFEPEDIAAAVRRAFEEKDAGIGARARAAVETAFSLERYAGREEDLYRSLDPA